MASYNTFFVAPKGTGDGTQSNPAPITAISDLPDNSTVYVQPGTYRLTAPITIQTDIAIIGNGAKILGSKPIHRYRFESKSSTYSIADTSLKGLYAVNYPTGFQNRRFQKFFRVTNLAGVQNQPGTYCVVGNKVHFSLGSNNLHSLVPPELEGTTATFPLISILNSTVSISDLEVGFTANSANIRSINSNVTLDGVTTYYAWNDAATELISNILITGTGTNSLNNIVSFGAKNDGLNFRGASQSTITNSTFFDCGDEAFSPHEASQGTATNCVFSGGGALPAPLPADGHTVAVVQGSSWAFNNCHFENANPSYALLWVADLEFGLTRADFTDCTFEDERPVLRSSYGLLYLGMVAGTVSNCTLTGITNPTPGRGRAISYNNQTAGKWADLRFKNITISNSRIGIETAPKIGNQPSQICLENFTFSNLSLNKICGPGWKEEDDGMNLIWK